MPHSGRDTQTSYRCGNSAEPHYYSPSVLLTARSTGGWHRASCLRARVLITHHALKALPSAPTPLAACVTHPHRVECAGKVCELVPEGPEGVAPSASHLPTAWTSRVAPHSPLRSLQSWGSLLFAAAVVSDTVFQHVLLRGLRGDSVVLRVNSSRIRQVPDVTTR